jgi:hypothetical protein
VHVLVTPCHVEFRVKCLGLELAHTCDRHAMQGLGLRIKGLGLSLAHTCDRHAIKRDCAAMLGQHRAMNDLKCQSTGRLSIPCLMLLDVISMMFDYEIARLSDCDPPRPSTNLQVWHGHPLQQRCPP